MTDSRDFLFMSSLFGGEMARPVGDFTRLTSLIPVNTVAPVISGTEEVGQTLSCTTGTWAYVPTSYLYQWRRDDAAIPSATSSTYLLVTADAGTDITCAVIAINPSGLSNPAVSNALTIPLTDVPINTVAPVISTATTLEIGETLSCTTGTWDNDPISYTYLWKRDGVGVVSGSTYVLSVLDIDTDITCAVTATNSNGDSVPATSNALSISEEIGDIDPLTDALLVSGVEDNTPDFTFDLPDDAAADDVLVGQYSVADADVWSTYFSHTLTAADIIADEITIVGVIELADGSYDFRFRREAGEDVSTWTTVTDVVINIAPDYLTLSPADGSSGHVVGDSLTVTFDKNIEFGTGTIVIYKTDDTLIESFDVATEVGTDPGEVSISGAVLTINPTSSLTASTGYYVQIAATAIENTDDIPFAGITNETDWAFTTAAAGNEYKVDTYFAGASTTWTAPADIVGGTATVALWAAGGASLVNAGSGGGGAFSQSNVAVVASTGYAVAIGAGATGLSGTNSTFASTTVVAEGGKADGAGNSGGLAANGTGTIKYSGGNGNHATGTVASGTGAGDSSNGQNYNGFGYGGTTNGGPASQSAIGNAFGGGGRSTVSLFGAGGPGHGRIFYSVPRVASFPFTALRHWGRDPTGDTTSHSVDLPDAIEAGDQVLIFFAMDGSTVTASATGYSSLRNVTDAANVSLSVLHKTADGGEGSSIVVTSSASEAASWVVAIVRGGGTPTAHASGATGSTTAPTSPSYSPAGGSNNYLWFSCFAADANAISPVTAYPASWGNTLIQPAGGAAGGSGVTCAVAERRQATATQTTAAWTIGVIEQWAAVTVAVPPV